MKTAIVSAELIAKTDIWNVQYYLGGPDAELEVQRAKENLKRAKARVKRAEQKLAEQNERVQKFVADGLVKI